MCEVITTSNTIQRNLNFFILSLSLYLKRELNVVNVKFSLPVIVDAAILSISSNSVLSKVFANYIGQQYLSRVNARRERLIEQKFGVKYIFTLFPPDMLWNDYGERVDFLPKENDLVVDVGAYIGDWSVIVGKYYKAKVIAIEPSLMPFKLLLKNIQLNGLNNQIVAVNCALFSEDKEIPMGFINSSDYAFYGKQDQSTSKISAKTLDTLLLKELNVSKIDLIKIDTEGAEYEILKGAMETISRLKPKIIVEVHSDKLRNDVIETLRANGYELVHEKTNFVFADSGVCSILYLST
jgi:FkbM family methyltransferase